MGIKFRICGVACAIAFLAATLSGCFGAKKPEAPKPIVAEFVAVAAEGLNPDTSGRASPLLVRVYSLRKDTAFNEADFFSLYERDEQILAADLVAREELVLKPGETVTLKREFAVDVEIVAVMAAYRDIERSTWRAAAPIRTSPFSKLTLKADANAVSLESEK